MINQEKIDEYTLALMYLVFLRINMVLAYFIPNLQNLSHSHYAWV